MPSSSPVALIVGGYAGSGKTKVGRLVSQETGWPILDKDTMSRDVVEAALAALGQSPNDRESDIYRSVLRPAEYRSLIAAMEENLLCGVPSVVIAPFGAELRDPDWCASTRERVAWLGGTAMFAWVRCDIATLRDRIRRRDAARDIAKLTDWDRWASMLDADFAPAADHAIIDNSGDERSLRNQALDLVRSAQKTG